MRIQRFNHKILIVFLILWIFLILSNALKQPETIEEIAYECRQSHGKNWIECVKSWKK